MMSADHSNEIIQQVLQDLSIKSSEVLQLNERSASLKVERFGATRFLKILVDGNNLANIEQDMLLHNFLSFLQDQQPKLIFRVPKILAYDKNWFISEFFEMPHLLPIKRSSALDVSFTAAAFQRHLPELVQLFIDTDITIGWHGRARPLYVDASGRPNIMWRAKRKEIASWSREAIMSGLISRTDAERLLELVERNIAQVSIAWEHGELWPSNCYRFETDNGEPKIGLIDFDRGKMFGARFFDVVRMFIVLYSKFNEVELAQKFVHEYIVRQSISAQDFVAASLPLLIQKVVGTAHDMAGLLDTPDGQRWRKQHDIMVAVLLSSEPAAIYGL